MVTANAALELLQSSSASSLPPWLRLLGIIAGLLGALIVGWRFFYVRPNIALRTRALYPVEREGRIHTNIGVNIKNIGIGSGESVYLELESPDWNFEYDGDSADESIEFSEYAIDFEHSRTPYIGGGEVNQMFFNNTIYSDAEFKVFWGEADFERFREYELNYRVATTDSKPREGRIIFNIGYDNIDVRYDDPVIEMWRGLPRRLKKKISRLNGDPTPWHDIDTELTHVTDPIEGIKMKSEGMIFIPRGFDLPGQAVIKYRIRIPYSNGIESYFDSTVTSSGWLEPGDWYEHSVELTFPSDEEYNVDKLETEITVGYETHEVLEFPNVELISHSLSPSDPENNPGPVLTVEGEIQNKNTKEQTAKIYAQFLDEFGTVIDCADTRKSIGGMDTETFGVSSDLSVADKKRVDDYRVKIRKRPIVAG